MQFRTDLAIEVADEAQNLTKQDIEKEEFHKGEANVTRLHIRSERGARALGKPEGAYITVEVPPLSDNEDALCEIAALISEELTGLLPREGTVLVVGLGNRAITPDTLGPDAGRYGACHPPHRGEFARSVGLDDLRPTAVITPGVLGQTGTESGEIVRGVCSVVHPAAVVVIDALAAAQRRPPGLYGAAPVTPASRRARASATNRQPLNQRPSACRLSVWGCRRWWTRRPSPGNRPAGRRRAGSCAPAARR